MTVAVVILSASAEGAVEDTLGQPRVRRLVHLPWSGGALQIVVVSPGPGRPEDAGVSIEVIRRLGPTTPTLGVCLGHQAIIEAFGGDIGQAKALLHGKASVVTHDGAGVFAGLPAEVEVGRYHSLAATTVPDELEVTSRTHDGEVMGVRHVTLPIEGVQFHPESVLTPLGPAMARNFLS